MIILTSNEHERYAILDHIRELYKNTTLVDAEELSNRIETLWDFSTDHNCNAEHWKLTNPKDSK